MTSWLIEDEGEDLCRVLSFHHAPVLLQETTEALALVPDAFVVDCTAGEEGTLPRCSASGRAAACWPWTGTSSCSSGYGDPLGCCRRDGGGRPRDGRGPRPFAELDRVLRSAMLPPVSGRDLTDLGVSSHQLDSQDRLFRNDGPLDMRMDTSRGPTANGRLSELNPATSCSDLATRSAPDGSPERSSPVAASSLPRTADLAVTIEGTEPGAVEQRLIPQRASGLAHRSTANSIS